MALKGLKKNLRTLMGAYVGLVRSENGLHEARERIDELRGELEAYTPENYKDLLSWQEIQLMPQTATLIADAAWKRKESLGAHCRADS